MDPISLLLLAFALSLDSLTVGLLYGARGIRLPWGALLIVSMATGLLLSLAMAGGRMVSDHLPPHVAERAGALVLASVGAWITYQTWRSQRGREPGTLPPPAPPTDQRRPLLRLRLGSVGIVIEILREPGAADIDRSGHINPVEACLLGIALALDSVAAGLGAAMAGFSPYGLPVAAALASFGLMLAGSRGARFLPVKLSGSWSAVHGVVLVLLGLYRIMAA